MNKKVFTVKDENGNELELAIKKPTANIRIDSNLIYNREWKRAVDEGSMLKRNVEKEAEKLGLWNNEIKKKTESIANQLRSLELQLRGGANSFANKEDAKACAFQMKELRSELIELNRSKDELYPYTAESFADDARLKYFVSQCCIDNNTGKQYFKSYSDYLSQSDSIVAQTALTNYVELMYSDLNDFQKEWYEYEWLRNNGYMDDKYRLIDNKGRLIDTEGRLVSESGRYINENNEFVDKDGNRVDEDGNYLVDYKSF